MFAGFHKGVVETIGGTQAYLDEVQRAIDDGWDRTLAETRAGFILWGTEAGLTYDQAFADYARYEQAVRDGNTELMNQIEADYARYQAASEDVTTQVVADADEIADRFAHMSAEEVFELREALRAIKPVAVDTFRGDSIKLSWGRGCIECVSDSNLGCEFGYRSHASTRHHEDHDSP